MNYFDWSITNKEFVLYIPNFGRKNLLIPTLKRFFTSVDKNKYLILVVNDGIHEDMSDLEHFNLKWFTFQREPANERNGCMIRNFVIRNCQSEWLCTKDPEIIIDGDIVSKILSIEDDVVYRPKGMIELFEQNTQQIIDDPFIDLTKLPILRQWEASDKRNQAFHAGCAMRTKRLSDMHGYDERYKKGYGYEDWQMLERLKKTIPVVIDKDIQTYHIAHPIIRKFHKTIINNEDIYKSDLKNLSVMANEGEQWGEGV
jgi:hypothetical protein